MSIKIMAQVWELQGLSSTEKLVLLAYTDHADSDGGNIFPAVKSVSKKTGLTPRSVQLITRGLEQKGYLVPDGKGWNGTNKYRFSMPGMNPEHRGDESDSPPPESDSPKSSVNHHVNHHKRGGEQSSQPTKPKAHEIPELVLFRQITGYYPVSGSWDSVIKAMQMILNRMGGAVHPDELRPFYKEWCDRGYNTRSIKWLSEWAVAGKIPQNNGGKVRQTPQQSQAELQDWLRERQAQNGR